MSAGAFLGVIFAPTIHDIQGASVEIGGGLSVPPGLFRRYQYTPRQAFKYSISFGICPRLFAEEPTPVYVGVDLLVVDGENTWC